MTWQLLPLGATVPSEAVRFMNTTPNAQTIAEVQDFIDDVRSFMDEAEKAGSDMGRVATVYDVNLQSVKKMTSADLVVAVSSNAEGQIVVRKSDPNQTHPYTASQLVEKVNERRVGRRINAYDHQAACWVDDLRTNPRYAWKHSNAGSHMWSGDAVDYLAKKSDEEYDTARKSYGVHLAAKRHQAV